MLANIRQKQIRLCLCLAGLASPTGICAWGAPAATAPLKPVRLTSVEEVATNPQPEKLPSLKLNSAVPLHVEPVPTIPLAIEPKPVESKPVELEQPQAKVVEPAVLELFGPEEAVQELQESVPDEPQQKPTDEPAADQVPPTASDESPREELPAAESKAVPMQQRPALLPDEVPLADVGTKIAPPVGKLPQNLAADWIDEHARKDQTLFTEVGVVYYWDAPNFCYRPLYFEEPNLERLGYSRTPWVQPATSGIHFFASTLALPYQMTVHRPRECVAPLGHYRPGSPAPYRRILPEWDAKAAAVQAAAVTGLIFILP